MLSDEDLNSLQEELADTDAKVRSIALRHILRFPSGDPRLPPLIQPLLDDRTSALLGIPLQLGEIRWLALRALDTELRAQGRSVNGAVARWPRPYTPDELLAVARETGIETPSRGADPTDRLVALYAELAAAQHLELVDVVVPELPRPDSEVRLVRTHEEARLLASTLGGELHDPDEPSADQVEVRFEDDEPVVVQIQYPNAGGLGPGISPCFSGEELWRLAERTAEAAPREPTAFLRAAGMDRAAGLAEQALRFDALAADPERYATIEQAIATWMAASVTYRNQGVDERRDAERAAERNPADKEAWIVDRFSTPLSAAEASRQEPERLRVLLERGDAFSRQGLWPRAKEDFEAVIEGADRLGLVPARVAGRVRLGRVLRRQGRLVQGLMELQEAHRLATGDPRSMADVQLELGRSHLHAGHAERAVAELDRAVEAFAALGSAQGQIAALHALAMAQGSGEGRRTLRRALALIPASEGPRRAPLLLDLAELELHEEDPEAAIRAAVEAAQSGDAASQRASRLIRADAAMVLGRTEQAMVEQEALIETAKTAGDDALLCAAAVARATLALDQESPAAALGWLEHAVPVAPTAGRHGATALAMAAELQAEAGRDERAAELAAHAESLGVSSGAVQAVARARSVAERLRSAAERRR